MAPCATTALPGAVTWSCVRGASGRFGGVGAGAGFCVFPVSPFSRCLWRAVLSGCPLSALAGTPFHAVCAFRGGRLLPVCGASGVGRSPTPDRSSFGACGRGPLPTGCGCGLCGRADPSPNPQRAPLQAGFVRFGGGTRAPGVGASRLGVGSPGSGALPPLTARPWGRAARAHYPLAVGAEGAGLGTRHQPHRGRCCKLALRGVGAAKRRPGEAPPASVWGVRGRALSRPRPLILWGVRPGPTTHWPWVRGVRALGPVTNTTARAHASWLCALWWRHEGARGGRLSPGPGASGVGRSTTMDRSSLGVCGQGPLPTGCGCGGMQAWGPVTNPTARALVSSLCALLALHKGAQGKAPLASVWGVRGQALSHPRPLAFSSVRPRPTNTGCGCGGGWRGDPSPTPQRTLLRACFARCGGGTRAPGGGASCLGVGRPGSCALPTPTAHPLGRAAKAHYPLAVGADWVRVGTRHLPRSARSCELALRAVGVAQGRPGGAPLAWAWGVRCQALSHPQRRILLGVRPGPTTDWLWVRRVRAWGPVTNPTAHALASWLCALWERHEGAQGGALVAWVLGRLGSPTATPLRGRSIEGGGLPPPPCTRQHHAKPPGPN